METGFGAFIDKDIATCLFAGIMTDTGCFSFNSSNRATWETVAALLDYGISKDLIYYRIYDNYSADRMRLLGYCLNHNMTVLPEYHTAYITLSREDMRHYNFQTGDSEGFVNYPLSIKGIRFSVLFIEKEDRIRISFRSRGNFSVNEFARKHFQGGGHNNASGGDSFLSLDDTVARFRQLLPEYGKDLADYEE
jgi:phosphoesterase RecJ-like protein